MRVTNGLALFIGFRHRRRPFWRKLLRERREGKQIQRCHRSVGSGLPVQRWIPPQGRRKKEGGEVVPKKKERRVLPFPSFLKWTLPEKWNKKASTAFIRRHTDFAMLCKVDGLEELLNIDINSKVRTTTYKGPGGLFPIFCSIRALKSLCPHWLFQPLKKVVLYCHFAESPMKQLI